VKRALVLGGTGLIGTAIAHRLLAAGWRVDLAARRPEGLSAPLAAAGARFVAADREDPAALAAALGGGADLLVDCLCYTAAHARTLLPLLGGAGCGVVLSARAVYADARGNHLNSPVPPVFDGPVREDAPTVPPGGGEYRSAEGYGRNKAAAERVLLDSGLPVTVVRPSQVYGERAARPPEWYFVKRALDGRTAVALAHRGTRPVQRTAAATLAALVETVAARPAARVLNCADPDAPTALDAVRATAARTGGPLRAVPLDGPFDGMPAGPWFPRYDLRLDTSAATALGHVPAGRWADLGPAAVDRMIAAARPGPHGHVLPDAEQEYFDGLFDYAAEDRHLAAAP
jgi:nucleoside-diphosphate-sugar epimerase